MMDTSSVLSDEDYDVISNPGQRSPGSSVTDFGHVLGSPIREIPPTDAARLSLSTVSLTPVDIQAYVRTALSTVTGRGMTYPADRTVRVYVDGVFDVLDAGRMLRLRQAKLSFASVYLIVGVFPDETCHVQSGGGSAATALKHPHVERCEALRHVKWVDEIVPDAPWVLDDAFMINKRIDYVALEEGSSVNPEFDKERLKGYDELKRIGRVIPARRTFGLAPKLTTPSSPPSRSANATPDQSAAESRLDTFPPLLALPWRDSIERS
ncbi:hypothetical protein F5141DRAFT_1046131 [Pisolithus sp. B1]|nr:hypothetical protein F5141DRAFT_1046131 [Pisolithus sp. B1]